MIHFRTPEEVAPELGLKPATLRRFCRETGICTRLERDRITLSPEDVDAMKAHIKNGRTTTDTEEIDPFAA